MATLVIDLAVAREAILHQTVTAIFHRDWIHGLRADRAAAGIPYQPRQNASLLPIHFTDRTEQLYKVSPNPGGPVPLRVQKV